MDEILYNLQQLASFVFVAMFVIGFALAFWVIFLGGRPVDEIAASVIDACAERGWRWATKERAARAQADRSRKNWPFA